MTASIPDKNCFSAAALSRWDQLGSKTQALLLGNVWCGACRTSVHIIVESGRIEKSDLILTGRCADCGGPVARLIESA